MLDWILFSTIGYFLSFFFSKKINNLPIVIFLSVICSVAAGLLVFMLLAFFYDIFGLHFTNISREVAYAIIAPFLSAAFGITRTKSLKKPVHAYYENPNEISDDERNEEAIVDGVCPKCGAKLIIPSSAKKNGYTMRCQRCRATFDFSKTQLKVDGS